MTGRDKFSKKELANDLTWREQEVLALLSERLTNREIANRLHLAESTVKDYVGKILGKLYVKNRRQAVEQGKALGLLNLGEKKAEASLSKLPSEPTPFIGRVDELEEIRYQLGETRLLTLSGPGGIGKTRLALKIAADVVDNFDHGSFFVSLAPIGSAKDIIQTLAEAVDFPLATHEDPQAQLLHYLQKRQLLLVMDNFEHLLEGVGIVNEILQAAPRVKILATSREKLNLQSETILDIGGMDFPDQVVSEDTAKNDAITLFVQSARKIRPGFAPALNELKQIGNICQIVQGMPLAIELAASWLHILTVDEIGDELEKGFDILATEVRDAPERHRSIRAVFDHSWSLLHKTEQEVLMLLSVFRGGFTRKAAEQLAGASLQTLSGLVNKSLLSHNPHSARFAIQDLLRQYAQERLDETPEASILAQEAHASYYAEFMDSRRQHVRDRRQAVALKEIEDDIVNIRFAWRYRVDQANAAQMRKFLFSYWFIYLVRGWNLNAVALFKEAVAVLSDKTNEEESKAVSALAMGLQGYFMAWLGLSERGYKLSLESVKILEGLDRPRYLAKVLDGLSLNAYYLSLPDVEEEAKRKINEISIEIEDDWLLAYSQFLGSLIGIRKQDFFEAKQQAESSLSLFEQIGDEFFSAFPLLTLGHIAVLQKAYQEAEDYYLKAIRISEKMDFRWLAGNATKYLGKMSLSLNKTDQAISYFIKGLLIAEEIGLGREKTNLLYEIATVRIAENRKKRAVELLSLVLQLPTSNLARIEGGRIRDKAQTLLDHLKAELSPEIYTAALERGQKYELDQIITDLVGSKH